MQSAPRNSLLFPVSEAQPAEAYGGPKSLAIDSIYDFLRRGLEISPDGVAFISAHQPSTHLADTMSSSGPTDVDCLHWTYRQLNETSLKLATHLAGICAPGQRRLVCFVGNSIEHAILTWAVAHMRGIFVPLDPTLLMPGREESRDWYINYLKPDVVVASRCDDGFDRLLSSTVPDVVKISVAETDALPSSPSWRLLSSVLRSVTVEPTSTLSHSSPPDPAASFQILFTSGTVSKPKPVAHSAAQVTPWLHAAAQKMPPSLTGMASTASFRSTYVTTMLLVHHAGATFLNADSTFKAATSVAGIVKYKPQMLAGVPALFSLIVTEASRIGTSLSSLRIINVGGDVVTSDVLEKIRKTCPNALIRTVYGMTEIPVLTSWSTMPNSLPSLSNNVVAVGSPTAGVILRICTPRTLDPLKRGEAGELWVTSEEMLDSYLDGRAADQFRIASDLRGKESRWFCTGDTALLDKNDHLYVLGRYKDIIVRGGINLCPVTLETALSRLSCPDAHVIGVPHESLGSAPVAIVRALETDAKQLIDDVVRMLGPEYQLENIWTLQDLGLTEWVYNASGKVSKTDLQRLLRETVKAESWAKASFFPGSVHSNE